MTHRSSFNETLITDQFEFGEYTIVFGVRVQYRDDQTPDYESKEYAYESYFRDVYVYAIEDSIDLMDPQIDLFDKDTIEYKVFDFTSCRIREEPYDPDINIPEDPPVSVGERLQVFLSSDLTVDKLKQQKRDEAQARWEDAYEPEGPIVPLHQQLDETIRPVLSEVETQLGILGKDPEIEIEVVLDHIDEEQYDIDEAIDGITSHV